MEHADPQSHKVAWRLLLIESGGQLGSAQLADAVQRACHKMLTPLARLIGSGGFYSVAARALYLAKAEAPFLDGVEVQPPVSAQPRQQTASGQAGTCFKGLHEGVQGREPTEVRRGVTTLFASFIWVLTTLIGEDIVLALMREVWPEVSFDDSVSSSEEVKY